MTFRFEQDEVGSDDVRSGKMKLVEMTLRFGQDEVGSDDIALRAR
jgi:hypothetical protein